MGILSKESRRQPLAATTQIGRNPACLLQLDDHVVSQFHAALTWQEEGWELRDLGSTNGTFVNGRRLSSRARMLAKGDCLGFGTSRCEWRLEDATGPRLMAQELATGEVCFEHEGVLCIPSEARAIYTISASRDGYNLSESGVSERAAEEQERLVVGESRWRLYLPIPNRRTHPYDPEATPLEEPHLTFKVSLDEEHVDMVLHLGEQESHYSSRAEHYFLLTLARKRLAETEEGLPASEAGWYEVDALCRALRMDEGHLNVQVHRARARLRKLNYLGPGGIVERRTRQLRIATGHVRVVPRE